MLLLCDSIFTLIVQKDNGKHLVWEDRDTQDMFTNSVAFGSHGYCTGVSHIGCHHWNLNNKKTLKNSCMSSKLFRPFFTSP